MRDHDIVIVGSGPVGAAIAQALVEGGADVLMLEAGKRPEPDRFAKMDEALRETIPWPFPEYPYEMVGDDIELNEFAIRRVGGSSLAWGAITPRFQPNDFRLKSRYGVGNDWPVSYDDLEKYYCQAERFLGVSGASDNPWAQARSEPFPMGNFPMNDTDLLVKQACEPLGIKMHSVPVARNSEPYQGRSACLYYSTCRACPIGAMFGSDRVVEKLEKKPNFRLLTEVQAARVEVDKNDRVSKIVYFDERGAEQAVNCKILILATQTVENVRILLNSQSGSFPRGLGNRSGRLGLELMEHPKFYLTYKVRQRLHPFRQGFETATTYQFHDHAKREEYAGGRLLVRENAGMTVAGFASESGRWGKELKEEIQGLFGRYVTLGAFLEQLPYDENRVSLSDSVKDQRGLPAAKVHFKLMHEYETEGLAEMKKVMESIFGEIGGDYVDMMPGSNSGHYMGGHKMGSDPADSVTNSYLESHEVKNLFLASGGAFPTAGVSNPTLTSVALAFRTAAHILGREQARE